MRVFLVLPIAIALSRAAATKKPQTPTIRCTPVSNGTILVVAHRPQYRSETSTRTVGLDTANHPGDSYLREVSAGQQFSFEQCNSTYMGTPDPEADPAATGLVPVFGRFVRHGKCVAADEKGRLALATCATKDSSSGGLSKQFFRVLINKPVSHNRAAILQTRLMGGNVPSYVDKTMYTYVTPDGILLQTPRTPYTSFPAPKTYAMFFRVNPPPKHATTSTPSSLTPTPAPSSSSVAASAPFPPASTPV